MSSSLLYGQEVVHWLLSLTILSCTCVCEPGCAITTDYKHNAHSGPMQCYNFIQHNPFFTALVRNKVFKKNVANHYKFIKSLSILQQLSYYKPSQSLPCLSFSVFTLCCPKPSTSAFLLIRESSHMCCVKLIVFYAIVICL